MKIPIRATIAAAVFHLALSGNALSGNAFSNELAERAAVKSVVVTLLRGEQFSKLEALSAKYRTSKSRTSSGIWRLSLFYAGVASAFTFERNKQEFWLKAERSAKKWVAAYPDSATARLAYARMLINRGWSYRGTGYAHTVKRQDWKPFHDYVQQARVYLEKHRQVASNDPYWYELMARIGYTQGWPDSEFSKLISEALQREPLFYQTYFAAIDYYTPKWRGSAAAIEKFARKTLEQTKAAEGYGMYARVYWYASQTHFGDKLFSESLVDWPMMKRGIDDVLKKYPDRWNINNFARFACLAKDRAKTSELFARIGNSPLPAAWRSRLLYQHCKAWASLTTPTPRKAL